MTRPVLRARVRWPLAVLGAACFALAVSAQPPKPPAPGQPAEGARGKKPTDAKRKPRAAGKSPEASAPAANGSATAVAGATQFALELYGRFRGREGNLVLSPVSISTALTMTYAGARGETAKEMAAALHLPADAKGVHQELAGLLRALQNPDKGPGVQLALANALWGQKGTAFLPEFVKLLEGEYGAAVRELDFGADEARQAINAWVAEQTRQKVPELFKPQALDPDTSLVLCNAVYFKGAWAVPFARGRTKDDVFRVAPSREVTVPLMFREGRFRYLEADGLQALELPYTGGTASLVVLLPKAADGLAALEHKLSPALLTEFLARMQARTVAVHLPRWKLDSGELALRPELEALGLGRMFQGGGADFSGMTAASRGMTSVTHQALIEVNEDGTEAAAVTAVKSARSLAPPVVAAFKADHPFLFLIRDTQSGALLFLGRLVNPRP